MSNFFIVTVNSRFKISTCKFFYISYFFGRPVQFTGFSFTFNLCYFCQQFFNIVFLAPDFFREITTFTCIFLSFDKKKLFFFNFFFQLLFLRMPIASYGARVRGSVFKMILEFFLDSLNLMRPLQDLPSF